jgi:hypothetical protein
MYNTSIQQLKTWQECNTLQVCEKETTHAEGVKSPNKINSHKKFNINFLNNTFYLLIMFQHVSALIVSHCQGDLLNMCSLSFNLHVRNSTYY